MRVTDRLIKEKKSFHHMKESLQGIDYIFKNGKDELKVHVDKRTGQRVTDYSLNGKTNSRCRLPIWARDIVVDAYAFPFKSSEIKKLLKL